MSNSWLKAIVAVFSPSVRLGSAAAGGASTAGISVDSITGGGAWVVGFSVWTGSLGRGPLTLVQADKGMSTMKNTAVICIKRLRMKSSL